MTSADGVRRFKTSRVACFLGEELWVKATDYDVLDKLYAEACAAAYDRGQDAATIAALSAELEAVRALLAEAADEISSWGAYASEYFQDKHDLKGSVERFRLAALPVQARGE